MAENPGVFSSCGIVWLLKARLKVLLKVLIRLLKARLKVLLKVLIRLLSDLKTDSEVRCSEICLRSVNALVTLLGQ